MPHSNQVREFFITSKGIRLLDTLVGPDGVAIGSARARLQAEMEATGRRREHELARHERALGRKRRSVEAAIGALRDDLATDEQESRLALAETREAEELLHAHRSKPRRGSGDVRPERSL